MTLALIMPFMVVGALISSGSIKFAQFASSQNSQYIAVSGTFLPTKTQAETQIIKRQIIETIVTLPTSTGSLLNPIDYHCKSS
jgi:predicted Rossmann fold nucleotide-binding protein DprA/Smf involved in DNA uptake